MVLESLANPWSAEHRPHMLLLWGIVYALTAGLLAMLLFPAGMQSIVMVALAAGAAIPLMYNTIKYEEEKDIELPTEQKILEHHAKAIMVFIMLFLGILAGMTILYLVLPAPTAVTLFADQIETYKQINPVREITGYATTGGDFQKVLFNNLRVLFFCIVFSFLYGAGAIFVLSWNASVIALAIGNVVRTEMALLASHTGAAKTAVYLKVLVIDGFSRYLLHGLLEITSYIIAALAGGIISVAIIKKHYKSEKIEHIILDVSDLLLASFAILILAAVVEVYITPEVFL